MIYLYYLMEEKTLFNIMAILGSISVIFGAILAILFTLNIIQETKTTEIFTLLLLSGLGFLALIPSAIYFIKNE